MDFGDILDDWDKKTAKSVGKKAILKAERKADALTGDAEPQAAPKAMPKPAPNRSSEMAVDPLTAWLRMNVVRDKDAEERDEDGMQENAARSAAERRRRLRSKNPDATIDLHGLTRDEAWLRLSAFFADARRMGADKVLVVHGKGNHSDGESVLKRTTRDFVERCPFAGESGQAETRLGGSGATWVVLKGNPDQRSR